MLHNDTFNRREYVVSVILKVVDGYTVDEAVNVMQVLGARLHSTHSWHHLIAFEDPRGWLADDRYSTTVGLSRSWRVTRSRA